MAGSQQITVGTTAVLLASGGGAVLTPGPTGWFYLANGATQIFVGGPGVTTSNGAAVAATTGTLNGFLFAGDQIYGVTASSTSTVTVLTTGA